MLVGRMHRELQNAGSIKLFCDIPLKDTAHDRGKATVIMAIDWLSHFLSVNYVSKVFLLQSHLMAYMKTAFYNLECGSYGHEVIVRI